MQLESGLEGEGRMECGCIEGRSASAKEGGRREEILLSRRERKGGRFVLKVLLLYSVLYLWFSRAVVVFVSISGSIRPIMQPSFSSSPADDGILTVVFDDMQYL